MLTPNRLGFHNPSRSGRVDYTGRGDNRRLWWTHGGVDPISLAHTLRNIDVLKSEETEESSASADWNFQETNQRK